MMNYREAFEKWSTALAGTPHEAELLAMTEEEREESFFQSLEFGTAGMRGVMGLGTNRLNIFTVRRAAKGLAAYITEQGMQEKGIAIAYDSRHNSADFARETALVLAANGVTAYLFDQLQSVPLLSFSILHLGCAGGVVITASHNHKKYNGFKVYDKDGGQVSVADAKEITRHIHGIEDFFSILPMDEREAKEKGLLKMLGKEIDEAYYTRVKGISFGWDHAGSMADQLRVVYTPLFGSGYRHVMRLLGDMGIRNLFVTEEHVLPNGDFPGLDAPNPELVSSYELPIQYAEKHNADFIIATDPDSDRMGVSVRKEDGSFHTLTGNQIGCLLLDYICEHHKDNMNGKFVVKSIVSSQLAKRIASYYNVEMREVLTGFRFVAEIMKKAAPDSFLYAYEESFGYLEGDFIRDKDGVMSAIFLIQAAAYHLSRGRSLWQAVEWLYEKYGYYLEKTISVTAEGMEGRKRIADFMEQQRTSPAAELNGVPVVSCADLLRGWKDLPRSNVIVYDLQDGTRVILRPSGTEPKIKAYCFVNRPQRAAAEATLAEISQYITDRLKNM